MSCNKVGYESKKQARKDIRHIHVNNRIFSHKCAKSKSNKKMYVYLCPVCNKWHLTTRKQKRKY